MSEAKREKHQHKYSIRIRESYQTGFGTREANVLYCSCGKINPRDAWVTE